MSQSMLDRNSAPEGPVSVVERKPRGGHRRAFLLAAVLLATGLLAYFVPIRNWHQDAGQLRNAIASAGIWVYPAGIAAVAILVACGVPRLVMCGLAGMTLGFWWGLAVVQTGSLLGYYGVFLFIRWGGRDWALRHWPALRKWADLVHDHGTLGVLLIRQLPIHGGIVNLALGLSNVKHRHYLLGTLLGSLPEAIPATLAGAGLVRPSIQATASYLAIAMAALAIIWIGCGYLLKALRNSRAGAEILADAETLKGAGD
jgi:uncharacterized membrane protein YdjX (TVP38/TMEM64 family)